VAVAIWVHVLVVTSIKSETFFVFTSLQLQNSDNQPINQLNFLHVFTTPLFMFIVFNNGVQDIGIKLILFLFGLLLFIIYSDGLMR
jgi:hypothetical protein